ncbi:MAG: cation:proton antiporter [Alphaproteobacteria bacterium]
MPPDQAHQSLPYLGQALAFLAAAAVLPALCRWLRISPIVGFLLFGVAVGPGVLGQLVPAQPWLRSVVFSETEQVRLFAEVGVSLLLFTLGLELSFRRLWTLRRLVFGLGGLQLALCALVIAAAAAALGLDGVAAVILGAALALSSTAMVMQLLAESRRTTTPVGRRAFAILLLQDLAVAPLLLATSLLAVGDSAQAESVWLSLGELLLGGAVIVSLIVAAGRFVARPLLQLVGASRAPDAFMAGTLFIAVGASVATAAAGLSAALGAFLAGMLLAETEYRHQIEVDLEPFKGLLLGLFFASIGMTIQPAAVWPQLGWIALAMVGLMLVKAAIVAGLARLFGLDWPRAMETGVLLSQAGEFALVVLSLAGSQGVVEPAVAQAALIVAALSIMVTPFLAAPAGLLATRLEARRAAADAATADDESLSEHVIVIGFGRVGRQVARMLEAEDIPVLAVDRNPGRVAQLRRAGYAAMFGDGTRPDLLRRAGADRARAVVVTVDEPRATESIVRAVRREWQTLPLHCRASDRDAARQLLGIGASHATPETLESSLQLGASLLSAFGAQAEVVGRRVEQAREQFMEGRDGS